MSVAGFPGDKYFAFSMLDDSDVAPLENIKPFYRLLSELGLSATKVVWSNAGENKTSASARCSLEDPQYLEFILELRDQGFEIAWAGASAESNTREKTLEGLEQFRDIIGYYPRIYVNGVLNRESLYWGTNRIDQPLLQAVVQRAAPTPPGFFLGHVEGSPFWWGDHCRERIDYVLNLTFDDVNTARVNPSMPYHDPSRPFVRWWFSAADAENCADFNQLLRPDQQDRLERERGCCVVSARVARGFVREGRIDRLARKRLESIAARPGWFAPVSDILDFRRAMTERPDFQSDEWDRMQWKWSRDMVRRRMRQAERRDSNLQDTAISR